MSADLVQPVSYAIWRAWSREVDPTRAERRFAKLAPVVRERFEDEARAAIAVCEAHFTGAQA